MLLGTKNLILETCDSLWTRKDEGDISINSQLYMHYWHDVKPLWDLRTAEMLLD